MRSAQTAAPCEDCRTDDAGDLRCTCGSLLARYIAGAIELKCRRCKRTVLIPLDPHANPRRDLHLDLCPDRCAHPRPCSGGDPPP